MLFFGTDKGIPVKKASMILLFSLKQFFYITALLNPTIFQLLQEAVQQDHVPLQYLFQIIKGYLEIPRPS